ncbi:MAG TPA: ATP-binding protein [Thermodesulfatator sp.]|nr:ATP-binding protein [Thermodesulfatator sp.]
MARGERWRLPADRLRLQVDPDSLGVNSTEEIPPLEDGVMAQERAVKALHLGLGLKDLEFNIFVAGPAMTGGAYITKRLVSETARRLPRPSDWCYVHNFKDPDHPKAIELPPGKGRQFQKDMAELVENLKTKIPEIFESEAYINRKEEVIRQFNRQRAEIFEGLEKKVRAEGFGLSVEPTGMMIFPIKPDGKPFTPEEIMALPETEREKIKQTGDALQKELNATARRIQELEKELRRRLKDLDREVALQAIGMFIQEIKDRYQETPAVQSYLDEVKDDLLNHIDELKTRPPAHPPGPMPMPMPFPPPGPSFTRYEVNVIVDNSETEGAPVVFEANPTYPNLFGFVERRALFGALVTDFTMIKAGALHRANGGFLIVKALDLLRHPFSWEGLKRTIRAGEIKIEDLGEQFGLFTTKTLRPEPIPLRAKVILLGDPFVYHLLFLLDDSFREIFKVKAHLDHWVDRDEPHTRQFLATVAAIVQREGLLHLDKTGLARLIEFSCQLAGRQDKLSLKIQEIYDLLKEADFWAREEKSPHITAKHVQQAIEEREFRARLPEEHLHEAIIKDLIRIPTDGQAVGQVNGLSVYDLGDYAFGRPTRITANIAIGREGVINIEREADLSGKIHTKGVMILSGFLRERFAYDKPLTLTASLTFEQSYGLVEGDSASGAELFAIISALANVPIDQGIAVTGAVSQKGELLPVGGVTEKIEGFFRVCRDRGLTGNQGVIIPKANIADLMLKEEVLEAVSKGLFHIWAVETVEEALEILTGYPAGKRQPDGSYEEGSLFYLADQRLREMAKRVRTFMKEIKKETEEGEEERGEGS